MNPALYEDISIAVELREIAQYFEERGKPLHGQFLRKVADRHEVLAGAYSTASKGGWIAFDVAEPEGSEIVQQYLGVAVMEQSNPPHWAFPTARWRGIKESGASHWRYVEGPE